MRKTDRTVVAALAIAWALFQLALPHVPILDSLKVRAIHLAFAVALVFLTLPPRRRRAAADTSARPIPALNYVLAALSCRAVLYIMLDWNGIAMGSGRPLARDIAISLGLIVLLLEASRKLSDPRSPSSYLGLPYIDVVKPAAVPAFVSCISSCSTSLIWRRRSWG